MTEQSRYSAPAVQKAFAVLELISQHPDGLRMTDVVEKLSLPKTSTFVLLRSLEQLGYLVADPANRYRLTTKLVGLGMRALHQQSIVQVARRHLEGLVERTGLTVHLAGIESGDAVYLDRVDGSGFVRFDTYVGKRAPAHLTAVGKAILAFLPEIDQEDMVPALDLSLGTTRAVRSLSDLQRELEKIREFGYAIEDGEEVDGVRCVAAPIRPAGQRVVASVGVIQLASMLDDARVPAVAAEVDRTAAAIAQEISGLPARA